MLPLIRRGDQGSEVRDVQHRLADLGHAIGDPPGIFGDDTHDAVRTFQQSRGLFADGAVGSDTWRSLTEAGLRLGDRLLYLSSPPQRGDDVRELQDRLDRIGLDVGPSDGIYGAETVAAVADFQEMQGLKPDGQAGGATIASLLRVGRTHQQVSAAVVRERHRVGWRRPVLSSMAAATIVIDPGNSPGFPGHTNPDGVPEHEITWLIAKRVHGRLVALGARALLARGPGNSPTPSERAQFANDESADVVLSIHTNGMESDQARGVAAYYFGNPNGLSVTGQELADLLVGRLSVRLDTPNCRAHASTATLLRETQATAVAAELGFLTHPDEGRALASPDYQVRISGILVAAVADWLTGRATAALTAPVAVPQAT
ncbi:MAG TPA: peptidoglycan-binding protein [Nitriliruptoraceae bacterium]|nr:peptidoglycan-binding protein [Nitriliruptoraceae bacterium]